MIGQSGGVARLERRGECVDLRHFGVMGGAAFDHAGVVLLLRRLKVRDSVLLAAHVICLGRLMLLVPGRNRVVVLSARAGHRCIAQGL